MRESNRYHKEIVQYEKADGKNAWDGILVEFEASFFGDELRKASQNLFKGFEFTATATYLITEDKRAKNIEATLDRVYVEDEPSIVNAITSQVVHKLGKRRDTERKKVYLIELETK
jgi:hypothetical protein